MRNNPTLGQRPPFLITLSMQLTIYALSYRRVLLHFGILTDRPNITSTYTCEAFNICHDTSHIQLVLIEIGVTTVDIRHSTRSRGRAKALPKRNLAAVLSQCRRANHLIMTLPLGTLFGRVIWAA